jgi:hypothetical protein
MDYLADLLNDINDFRPAVNDRVMMELSQLDSDDVNVDVALASGTRL